MKKMETNKIKKVTPRGSQNILLHDIKKIDENKKMRKEYNARGERTYENSINRENAKKIRKIK